MSSANSVRPRPARERGRALAVELWKVARARGDQGRTKLALELSSRALAAAQHSTPPDARLEARILITKSYLEARLGEPALGLATLDKAAAVDATAQPFVEAARGVLLLRVGRTAEALERLDAAIPVLLDRRTEAEPADAARALLNRGLLQMTAGRLAAAHSDTALASALLQDDSSANGPAYMAEYNLGYIRFLQGDLPGALGMMAAASQRNRGGQAADGVPGLDRATVLLGAGLLGDAAEFAEQAKLAFTRNRATDELVDALGIRAEIALAAGDPGEARRAARRAARLAMRRGNERAATVARILELRADAQARRASGPPGHRPGARAAAARAGALTTRLSELGLDDDAVDASLLAGEALLDAVDSAAAEHVERTAAVAERSSSLSTRLHARVLHARVELERGRPRAGLAHIRRGLDDLASFQAKFGSQDLQSGASVHGRDLARLGLRTAVESGSPAAILQWLERGRAVSTRLPVVRPPADPALADDLGALRVAFDQARQAALAGKRDPARERKVAELRRQIRSRSWTAGASGTVHRPPTLAAVQRALATVPGATVVALFHGGGHDHALVVTPRRAHYQQLGDNTDTDTATVVRTAASDLDLLGDTRILAPLRRVARGSLAAGLQMLSGRLLEPVLDRLDDGPLLIVDAGPTAAAPWGLLPTLAGRAVSVTSSVTAALAGLAPATPAHHQGVLAVSGPDVDNGEKEARAVADLYHGAGLLVGDDATGRAVLDAVPEGGLLHVAAHGHHEPDNPLFSGLMLADGLLFGYDVAPNPALPAHVVLSSCDVGRSHDRPGGEPLGLVAALVRSGVRTVIASTSRIADDVAAPAMLAYHEGLLAGAPPAVALADAVAAVSAGTDVPVPLTCFGAGR